MDTITLMFVGVVVSLLVSYLKNKFVLQGNSVLLLVAVIALIGAFIYSTLLQFGYWDAVLNVIVYAGAFYAFIVKTIQDNK
ncbi:MAG: hypothetical protein WC499_02680 [Patescibacteria group bacterium]